MYFTGTITINPSDPTVIQKKKPTKFFSKVFHVLTVGALAEKEEQETFTALVILQQLNAALRSMGVTNIIRLAKDEKNIYYDEEGREDDLKFAVEKFHTEEIDPEVFDTLRLVLEHEDEELKYLIDLKVNRVHDVGEHPIEVLVNGIPSDFKLNRREKGAQRAKVTNSLEPIFESQESYDAFLDRKESAFEAFLSEIENAMRSAMEVKETSTTSRMNVIRPERRVSSVGAMPNRQDSDPVYYGYPHHDDYFLYAWYWSEMSHSHGIHYHDVTVVDFAGQPILEVGAEGFTAGATNVLNPDEPFEVPEGEDVTLHSDHGFQDEIAPAPTEDVTASADTGDGGGSWLDWFGGGDDGVGDDSGSSCSSCGGGCGGD